MNIEEIENIDLFYEDKKFFKSQILLTTSNAPSPTFDFCQLQRLFWSGCIRDLHPR